MEFGENKILTIFVFAFLEQFKDPITSNSREKLIVSHPFIIFVLAKYFNVHYETDKKSQDYVYGNEKMSVHISAAHSESKMASYINIMEFRENHIIVVFAFTFLEQFKDPGTSFLPETFDCITSVYFISYWKIVQCALRSRYFYDRKSQSYANW